MLQIREAVSFGVDKVLVPVGNRRVVEQPKPGIQPLSEEEAAKVVYVADILDVFEHTIEGRSVR